MTTSVYMHEDCRNHITPDGHPERVERLAAIEKALEGLHVTRREARMGTADDVLLCHPESYYQFIAGHEPGRLDADTHMSHGSYLATMRAVGGALGAVDEVMDGKASNAFVATRPPGHHAERETPMGFCLFGHVAIAAKHLLERHGLSRVAVVDFDVHHGNGTQDLLWDEARTLFITSQQVPHWPGTGERSEKGAHDNVMNIPLKPKTDGAVMRKAYEEEVFPALQKFAPEFLLVSAGFDSHADDPLADLAWVEDDFSWLTEKLCDLADTHCGGKLVSVLEGGYDLASLGRSVRAHVEVLKARG